MVALNRITFAGIDATVATSNHLLDRTPPRVWRDDHLVKPCGDNYAGAKQPLHAGRLFVATVPTSIGARWSERRVRGHIDRTNKIGKRLTLSLPECIALLPPVVSPDIAPLCIQRGDGATDPDAKE